MNNEDELFIKLKYNLTEQRFQLGMFAQYAKFMSSLSDEFLDDYSYATHGQIRTKNRFYDYYDTTEFMRILMADLTDYESRRQTVRNAEV